MLKSMNLLSRKVKIYLIFEEFIYLFHTIIVEDLFEFFVVGMIQLKKIQMSLNHLF